MEQKTVTETKPQQLPQPQSTFWGAVHGAERDIGFSALLTTGLAGGIKLFTREPYIEALKRTVSGASGSILLMMTAITTALGAFAGYSRAKQANALLEDNLRMRIQLDQTGAVLNHVADNLTQQRDAMLAVADAPASPHSDRAKPPAASHAEQAIADKEAAVKAGPTVH